MKVASFVSTGWQYECIMIRAVVLFAFVAILPYSSDAQSDPCGVNGLDGCPRLPDILNGQVNYIPESVRDCYERDTFARNTCDEGFRVTGPSSRACSGSFVDNRLESVEWEPNDNVTCEPVCPNITIGAGIASITYDNNRIIDSTAIHTCLENFIRDDDLVRICQKVNDTTAVWSTPEETCSPVCPVIVPGDGIATITYSNSDRTVGTVANHICREGFVPNFDLVRNCTGDANTAEWDLPEETCRPICGDLSPIANGSIIYDPDTVPREVDTTANYICDPGFRFANGDEVRVCTVFVDLSGADWDGDKGECLPQCPPLGPLGNGTISYSMERNPDFDTGTVATHVCNFGFVLVRMQDRTRICQGTHDWSGEPPMCQPIECEMLPPLENGEITYAVDMTANFELRTMATHTCDAGYILSGPEVRNCDEGDGTNLIGEWTETAPTCEPQCPPLGPLGNGTISYSMERNPDFDTGTVATHVCNFGFVLVRMQDRTRICQDTREWSGEPPMCQPIECEMLPPLENGEITYAADMTANFELRTMATHTCDAGYILRGSEVRICDEGDGINLIGEWTETAPTCEPIECEMLPLLANGDIRYSLDMMTGRFKLQTMATHTCNADYVLNGPEIRICTPGDGTSTMGVWSERAPTCEPQCPPLGPLLNGNITYSMELNPNYDPGTDATHVCNLGFVLIGSIIRVCQETTQWSEVPPTCQPIECPPLLPLLNGMISYVTDTSPDFEIGTVATYECDTNYCLNGVDNRICDFTGQWSEEAPFCELVNCEDLPVPPNGMITYLSGSSGNRPVGTVATFSCNQPFSLIGETFRTCELQFDDNGRLCEWDWTGIQPGCTITNVVNDTATGDPLMTVPLYITNTENIVGPGENDIVNLCFELHGTSDAYFNLISDGCVSVNAHYEEVLPSIPQEDINIIDSIHVRAVDDGGVCHNIDVSLDGCSASVDGISIDDMYRSQGISVRRFRNRVRIGVPNCQDIDLVMWVFCLNNTFWSTFRVNSDGTELLFQADMIRFVIARGLNLQERSHGLLGQFWNIPIQVEPYTGLLRNGSAVPDGYYTITVNHPNEVRSFTGWLYSLTWEYREEYCLYAGNQQAGPIYEIETPNDPVIEGGYSEYQVTSSNETDFEFSQFDESLCGN